jgi:hypothetical protein
MNEFPDTSSEGPIYTLHITEAALNNLCAELRAHGFSAEWQHYAEDIVTLNISPPQPNLPPKAVIGS